MQAKLLTRGWVLHRASRRYSACQGHTWKPSQEFYTGGSGVKKRINAASSTSKGSRDTVRKGMKGSYRIDSSCKDAFWGKSRHWETCKSWESANHAANLVISEQKHSPGWQPTRPDKQPSSDPRRQAAVARVTGVRSDTSLARKKHKIWDLFLSCPS